MHHPFRKLKRGILRRMSPKATGGAKVEMFHCQSNLDLSMSIILAETISEDRQTSEIAVSDLLAGMYVQASEKLAKYWQTPEDLEAFVTHDCGIREPRWLYQMRTYDQVFRPKTRFLRRPGRWWSPELVMVWKEAAAVGKSMRNCVPTERMELRLEDVIFALANRCETRLSTGLRESGLNLSRLEDAVRAPDL